MLIIQAPDGLEIEVKIPEGVAENEIFDVEYGNNEAHSVLNSPTRTASPESATSVDRDTSALNLRPAGSADHAQREAGWDHRFIHHDSISTEAATSFSTSFSISPGSAKYLTNVEGSSVYQRLVNDNQKRAAKMDNKIEQAAERENAQLRSTPKLSRGTQEMALKLSREDRQARLLRPCREDHDPEVQPRQTTSKEPRVGAAEVVRRMEQDRQERLLRQKQYHQDAVTQHSFHPTIPAKSIGITQQLGNLAESKVSARDPILGNGTTESALVIDSVAQELRSRLKASAYRKGGMDLRRLFQQYDRKNDGLLGPIEFARAVRCEGKLDRAKISDTEIGEIFSLVDVNKDNKVSFKEFQEFLNKRSTRRLKDASKRQTLSVQRQKEALQAYMDDLQKQKQEALMNEDYETAAILRDDIANLEGGAVLDAEQDATAAAPTDTVEASPATAWPASGGALALIRDDGPDAPDSMPIQAATKIMHCARWVSDHGREFEDTLKKKHLGATGWVS